jgi:hypothetical protein
MAEVYGVRPLQVGFDTIGSATEPVSPFVRDEEVMVRLEGFVWRSPRPGTVELRRYRNGLEDWLTSEPLGPGIVDAGYGMIASEGFALDPALPQPLGTIPLYTWLSVSRRDHLTSADDTRFIEGDPRTLHGERWRPVSSIDPDYLADRLEGFIYPPDRAAPAGTIPLVRWMDRRGEHFTTRTEDLPWLTGTAPLEVETGL